MIRSQTFQDLVRGVTVHDQDHCDVCEQMRKEANGAATVPPEDTKEDVKARLRDLEANAAIERTREREAITRALAKVDNGLKLLPDTANGAAGYLQALDIRGDLSGEGNAVAKFLKRVGTGLHWAEQAIQGHMDGIKIFATQYEIAITSTNFQVSMTPPAHVTRLIGQLYSGDHPKLVN